MNTHRLIAACALAAAVFGPGAAPSDALWGLGGRKSLSVPSAAVGSTAGDVGVRSDGSGAWEPASAGRALASGDRVKTGSGAAAVLAFSDGSAVQLGPDAACAVEKLEADAIVVRIDAGLLEAWVARIGGRAFEARGPSATVRARGTEFQVAAAPSGETTVDVFGGSVQVRTKSGATSAVESGQRISADPAGALSKPSAIPPGVTLPPAPKVAIPAPKAASPSGRAAPQPRAAAQAPAASPNAPAAAPAPPPVPDPTEKPQTLSPSSP